MPEWSPSSWQQFSCEQAIDYPDSNELAKVVERLSQFPPLVTCKEINNLKREIAQAGNGQAFILQGGDCAESFSDCRADIINNKLKILLQMSSLLHHGLQKKIVRIGRIAGQYTKPRSANYETIANTTLPCYRGDLVNSPLFSMRSRIANPQRLLKGYSYAAITLNFIRAMVNDFFISHEALHLHYEQALTRLVAGEWYDLSTHLPWVGMRSNQLNGAHLEFLRGIKNPIGVKIGPGATGEWLAEIIRLLNPQGEEGRLFLITRFGSKKIDKQLPPLIETAKKIKIPVTWACDPMHGNTEIMVDGIKTRRFDTILKELQQAVQIHREMSSCLGGVHFELTGENVTECLGGKGDLKESDLRHAYRSLVDPRLNYQQSLEMARQLSQECFS